MESTGSATHQRNGQQDLRGIRSIAWGAPSTSHIHTKILAARMGHGRDSTGGAGSNLKLAKHLVVHLCAIHAAVLRCLRDARPGGKVIGASPTARHRPEQQLSRPLRRAYDRRQLQPSSIRARTTDSSHAREIDALARRVDTPIRRPFARRAIWSTQANANAEMVLQSADHRLEIDDI
jgi:hypothetical protein